MALSGVARIIAVRSVANAVRKSLAEEARTLRESGYGPKDRVDLLLAGVRAGVREVVIEDADSRGDRKLRDAMLARIL